MQSYHSSVSHVTPLTRGDFAPLDPHATRLSYFPSVYHSDETRIVTLQSVIDEIQGSRHKTRTEGLRTLLSQAGEDAYKAEKLMLPGVTFAGTFDKRKIEKFKEPSGLLIQEVDCHPKIPDLGRCDDLKTRFAPDPFVVLMWTSPSAAGLRFIFRVPPVDGDDAYKALWSQVSDYIEQTYSIATDKSCKDISRLLFLSHDPALHLNPCATPFPSYRGARELIRARAELENMVDGERYLTRNKLGYTLGGHVAGGSLEEGHVAGVLNSVVERTTRHPDKSLTNFWKAVSEGKGKPIKPELDGEQPELEVQAPPASDGAEIESPEEFIPPQPDVEPPTLLRYTLDDFGNAKRYLRHCGHDLHYCEQWNKWLIWVETHWSVEQQGIAKERAKETIEAFTKQAKAFHAEVEKSRPAVDVSDALTDKDTAPQEPDASEKKAQKAAIAKYQKEEKQAGAILGFARKSRSNAAVGNMMALAQSAPGVPIGIAEMNGHPWLLNTLSGTVDLETGRLRPHNRKDRLTHMINLPYDPNANCHRWEDFLSSDSRKALNPLKTKSLFFTLSQA